MNVHGTSNTKAEGLRVYSVSTYVCSDNAVEIRIKTPRGLDREFVVSDPDMLVKFATQLLSASVTVREAMVARVKAKESQRKSGQDEGGSRTNKE